MAQKPLRPCRHPGCTALTKEGYCPAHKPAPASRRESAQYHSWYSLRIWTQDLRPAQLQREPFCRICASLYQLSDPRRRTRATVVDHIQPHQGNWALFVDPSNHQSLCKHHHDQKTAMEMAEKRRQKKANNSQTIPSLGRRCSRRAQVRTRRASFACLTLPPGGKDSGGKGSRPQGPIRGGLFPHREIFGGVGDRHRERRRGSYQDQDKI
nr:MAG TPA: HNH endonuclease [Caudoviricetes sp.]